MGMVNAPPPEPPIEEEHYFFPPTWMAYGSGHWSKLGQENPPGSGVFRVGSTDYPAGRWSLPLMPAQVAEIVEAGLGHRIVTVKPGSSLVGKAAEIELLEHIAQQTAQETAQTAQSESSGPGPSEDSGPDPTLVPSTFELFECSECAALAEDHRSFVEKAFLLLGGDPETFQSSLGRYFGHGRDHT